MFLTTNKQSQNYNFTSNLTLRSSSINKQVDYPIRDSILNVPIFINIPNDSDSLRDNIFNYPSPKVKESRKRKFPQKLKLKKNPSYNDLTEKLEKQRVQKSTNIKKNEDRSSLSLNRSFVVFEKQQYINKNASFIKTNQDNDSDEEEFGNRSYLFKPQEIKSKEEISNLINLYEPKNTGNSTNKKKNSALEKHKKIESINTNSDMPNDKTHGFKHFHSNIISTNFGKNGVVYSNNFNKFATKSWIDDAFDSPREKEFRNLENFEEDNELSNFNFSCHKDGLNNQLAVSNNFPLKEKKSCVLDDDEDFIFDGRNRHVFSFYNKNNQDKVTNSNLKKNNYTIVKSDIETISEHPHENVLNMSYNINNLSYLDGKNGINQNFGNDANNVISQNNFPIENNILENMNFNLNLNYKNNADLKIVTVNNFKLKKPKKIEIVNDIAKQVEKVQTKNEKLEKEQVAIIENSCDLELKRNEMKTCENNKEDELPFDIKNLNLKFNLIEKKKLNGNKLNLEGFLLKNNNICSNNNTNCNNLTQNSNLAVTYNIGAIPESEKNKNRNLQKTTSSLNELNSLDKENRNAQFKIDNNYTEYLAKDNLINHEHKLQSKINFELKQPNSNKLNQVISNTNSGTSSQSSNFYSSEMNKKVKFLDSQENKSELDSNIAVEKTKCSLFTDNFIKSNTINSQYQNNSNSPKINDLYNFTTKQTDINTCTFSNNMSNNLSSTNAHKNNAENNSITNSNKKNIPIPLRFQTSSISSSKKPPNKTNSSGVSVSRHSFSQTPEEDFSYSTLYKKKANKKINEIIDTRNKSYNQQEQNYITSREFNNHNTRADSTATRRTNNEETTKNENLNSKNFHNLNDIYQNSDKNLDTKNKTQIQSFKMQQTPQYQQFVVLQKHLPYSKYNLDLLPKTKAHDEKEVLYNNVADYQTLNQLINSVKKAYNYQMMQFKKTQNNKFYNTETGKGTFRSTSPVSRNDKFKFNERKFEKFDKLKIEKYENKSHNITNQNSLNSYNSINNQINKFPNSGLNSISSNVINKKLNKIPANQNQLTSNSLPISALNKKLEKDFENFSPDAIDENTLVELLEEIKERSNKIQTHFKHKEENMNIQIKELNENIKEFQEKEKNLREEIEVWKSKLAFFIEDFRKKSNENKIEANSRTNLFSITTKSKNELKSGERNLISNCEENLKEVIMEKNTKKLPNNEKNIQTLPLANLNLNDLPKIVSEKTFSQKYDLPKLKSFALILKEVGLDITTFYDQISFNELQDDLCEECFVNDVNKKKVNWDFSEDSIYSNRKKFF